MPPHRSKAVARRTSKPPSKVHWLLDCRPAPAVPNHIGRLPHVENALRPKIDPWENSNAPRCGSAPHRNQMGHELGAYYPVAGPRPFSIRTNALSNTGG